MWIKAAKLVEKTGEITSRAQKKKHGSAPAVGMLMAWASLLRCSASFHL
jgi:hypothetical protein